MYIVQKVHHYFVSIFTRMFIAASSATRYRNTYGTEIMLICAMSPHIQHFHSGLTWERADSTGRLFSRMGEMILPHVLHIRLCEEIYMYGEEWCNVYTLATSTQLSPAYKTSYHNLNPLPTEAGALNSRKICTIDAYILIGEMKY